MLEFDPGSFRDPDGRIFFYSDKVYRTVKLKSFTFLEQFLNSNLAKELIQEKKLINTEVVHNKELLDTNEFKDLGDCKILQHRKIEFISYSSEWSFEMLRKAALLTLEIQERALKDGYSLKDATAFNIAFEGANPVFFDVLSFEKRTSGKPWLAFGQFTRSFLFPLLIMGYKKIPFQPILRSLGGEIPISFARNCFSWSHFFNPVIRNNIFLQNALEELGKLDISSLEKSSKSTKEIKLEPVIANLRKVIEAIPAPNLASNWVDYESTNTYDSEDEESKRKFVVECFKSHSLNKNCLDVGANSGVYSEIIAPFSNLTLAIDFDEMTVDKIFMTRGSNKLLPLVIDITNPTPSMGWNNCERKSFLERAKPHFFMALALIHHLRINSNIPLASILDFFTKVAPYGIIEWVGKEDPMVKRLLMLKEDCYEDYTYENFINLLGERFEIINTLSFKNKREAFFVGAKK